MRKIFVATFLVLFSCGARKSSVDIQKESGKTDIESSQITSAKIENKGVLTQNNTIVDLGYGFSIEPINGQNSFFTLKSGNDSLQVHTNAKISFDKKNKVEKTETKFIYQTITTYQTVTTYKSHHTWYSYHKAKQNEKSAYPWFLWFILGGVVFYILQLIINKNNIVSFWNRITKKR